MDTRRGLRCQRCGKDFEFSQVRYLPDASGIACKACLSIRESEQTAAQTRTEKRYSYQCIGCRYMFQRTAQQPKSCPQCGKQELIKYEKEKLHASALLKIADDPRFDQVGRT